MSNQPKFRFRCDSNPACSRRVPPRCCAGPRSDGAYVSGVQELRRRFLQESGYDPASRPTNGSAEPTGVTVVIPLSEVTHFTLVGDWFVVALYFCEQRITVYNDSSAWSCAALKVKTPCKVDLRDFPNDKQTCSLRAGASAYSDREVKMAGYVTWGDPHVNASTESFIDVVFHLRRTARRHRYTFTIPGISSALAILVGFWMPPDSERRLTLACLNVFVLAVVLNRVTTLITASVTVPKMILFLGLGTLAVLFTAATSILVTRASRSDSRTQVPDSFHHFLSGFIATLLCISFDEPTSALRSHEHREVASFNASHERRRRWLILAKAVDRVFLVVFGVATLVFFI
ncbi:hypothetical protein HPB51_026627 [Rhipicephalus microplus]|uniref:Neurotransmitter-gated ion-channel ligand-binding domain-containing protein n=1 Tax=Rhipicephalus microplus TaxID=6941 RepID=A0A9J6D2H8_RHIMP|nr:hypothetical protein HPB51_026627 [Rhipicephalus microplus]